jgi:hypothetical protein
MELLVLGLVATIGFASYALWHKTRTADLPPSVPPHELDAAERTPATLQVGDVVQHLGSDYLIEGVLALSDDVNGAKLYRLVDGPTERYLLSAPGEPDPSMLEIAPNFKLEGTPSLIEHGGQSYQLRSRATGAALRSGSVGDRRAGHRVTLAEYGAGAGRLLILQWTDDTDAFVGERVPLHLLDFLPGR